MGVRNLARGSRVPMVRVRNLVRGSRVPMARVRNLVRGYPAPTAARTRALEYQAIPAAARNRERRHPLPAGRIRRSGDSVIAVDRTHRMLVRPARTRELDRCQVRVVHRSPRAAARTPMSTRPGREAAGRIRARARAAGRDRRSDDPALTVLARTLASAHQDQPASAVPGPTEGDRIPKGENHVRGVPRIPEAARPERAVSRIPGPQLSHRRAPGRSAVCRRWIPRYPLRRQVGRWSGRRPLRGRAPGRSAVCRGWASGRLMSMANRRTAVWRWWVIGRGSMAVWCPRGRSRSAALMVGRNRG